jgi:hypothetical protein
VFFSSDQPSLIEMKSSVTLRFKVCSESRYVFFTYCWVIVEPPWVEPPVAMLTTARAMPIGSTPLSVSKDSFSAAITAFRIDTGIWSIGTIWRFVEPPVATIWEPSAHSKTLFCAWAALFGSGVPTLAMPMPAPATMTEKKPRIVPPTSFQEGTKRFQPSLSARG